MRHNASLWSPAWAGSAKPRFFQKPSGNFSKALWKYERERNPSPVFYHDFREDEGADAELLLAELHSFLTAHGDRRLQELLTDPQFTLENKLNALLNALRDGKYYLVFDDLHVLLDEDGQIANAGLRNLFDRLSEGNYHSKILIASRREPHFEREIAGAIATDTVEKLPEEDALQLMKQLGYPQNDPERLKQIYAYLDGHPEAIRVLSGLDRPLNVLLSDFQQWGMKGIALFDRLLEEVIKGLNETEFHLLLLAAAYREPLTEAMWEHHTQYDEMFDKERLWDGLEKLVQRCVLGCERETEPYRYRLHNLTRKYLLHTVGQHEKKTLQQLHRQAAEYYDPLRVEDPM